MYRVIYKCPHCRKKPRTSRRHYDGYFVVGCCHMAAAFVTVGRATTVWNEIAAEEFARRAVSPQG